MWFSDLEKVLAIFKEKCPEVETFERIEGNIYGDFLICTKGNSLYLITHDTYRIYHHERNGSDNKWVKI